RRTGIQDRTPPPGPGRELYPSGALDGRTTGEDAGDGIGFHQGDIGTELEYLLKPPPTRVDTTPPSQRLGLRIEHADRAMRVDGNDSVFYSLEDDRKPRLSRTQPRLALVHPFKARLERPLPKQGHQDNQADHERGGHAQDPIALCIE